jgi:hypothetical protein
MSVVVELESWTEVEKVFFVVQEYQLGKVLLLEL